MTLTHQDAKALIKLGMRKLPDDLADEVYRLMGWGDLRNKGESQ